MREERRTAVITGGNRGLGLETCRQLAEQGYRVVLGSRSLAQGQEAARSIGLDPSLVAAIDVDSEESIDGFVEWARSSLDRIDVLVNNAGVLARGKEEQSVLTAPCESVMRVMQTNLLGAMRMIQRVVPWMRRCNYGRIVNVSSGLGQLEAMGTGSVAYRLSKTAMNALTRTLAAELCDENILVNAVCPGWVRTDMGGVRADRSVEHGAKGIVWAATLAEDGPRGGFFRDGARIPW